MLGDGAASSVARVAGKNVAQGLVPGDCVLSIIVTL